MLYLFLAVFWIFYLISLLLIYLFIFLICIYSKVYPVRAFDVANAEQLYYTPSDYG